jgi:hypothetical protein
MIGILSYLTKTGKKGDISRKIFPFFLLLQHRSSIMPMKCLILIVESYLQLSNRVKKQT